MVELDRAGLYEFRTENPQGAVLEFVCEGSSNTNWGTLEGLIATISSWCATTRKNSYLQRKNRHR